MSNLIPSLGNRSFSKRRASISKPLKAKPTDNKLCSHPKNPSVVFAKVSQLQNIRVICTAERKANLKPSTNLDVPRESVINAPDHFTSKSATPENLCSPRRKLNQQCRDDNHTPIVPSVLNTLVNAKESVHPDRVGQEYLDTFDASGGTLQELQNVRRDNCLSDTGGNSNADSASNENEKLGHSCVATCSMRPQKYQSQPKNKGNKREASALSTDQNSNKRCRHEQANLANKLPVENIEVVMDSKISDAHSSQTYVAFLGLCNPIKNIFLTLQLLQGSMQRRRNASSSPP